MWPNFSDLVLIYALLTPTSVLYWHTTTILLGQWVGNNEIQLLLGLVSAVAIAYCHDAFRRNAPTLSGRLVQCIYESAYEYVVKMSCLCYHLGCRTIYDILLKISLHPVHIAIIAAFLLICVRGFRNVLTLPIVLNNDSSVDRYRPASTLTFSEDMMTDDVLRITVVWSTVAVFWHATGEAVAASAGLSGSTLLLYGYIGVALVMTIGRGITETFISLRSNETYKLGVEAAYIAMSAVAGITLWEGLDIHMSSAMSSIGAVSEDTAPNPQKVLASQFVAFSVMKCFGVMGSLYARNSSRDGEGINFNTVIQMSITPSQPS